MGLFNVVVSINPVVKKKKGGIYKMNPLGRINSNIIKYNVFKYTLDKKVL